MGIDVVDFLRCDRGVAKRHQHRTPRPVTVGGGRRDVVGVAGHPVADDLRVDTGAAPQRRGQALPCRPDPILQGGPHRRGDR